MFPRRKTPADLARFDAKLLAFSRRQPVSFSLMVAVFGTLFFLVAMLLTSLVVK